MARTAARVKNRLLAAMMLAGLAAAAMACGGCTRTVAQNPLNTNYAVDDANAELDFWHSLSSRSAVTNDEGLHGLILLEDGVDRSGGYEGRVQIAKDRGWVSRKWREPADVSMQRGTMAAALVKICGVKGGVWLRLLGNVPRYAVRELVFLRIMPDPSGETQSMTGLEFVGTISKAQDYILLQGMSAEAPAGAGPGEAAPVAPAGEVTPEQAPAGEAAPGA